MTVAKFTETEWQNQSPHSVTHFSYCHRHTDSQSHTQLHSTAQQTSSPAQHQPPAKDQNSKSTCKNRRIQSVQKYWVDWVIVFSWDRQSVPLRLSSLQFFFTCCIQHSKRSPKVPAKLYIIHVNMSFFCHQSDLNRKEETGKSHYLSSSPSSSVITMTLSSTSSTIAAAAFAFFV